MKNVKLLVLSLGFMSLTACLENKSSTDTPASNDAPPTAAQMAVASAAGCTVAKTGNHMTMTCGSTSATFEVGSNGNNGNDGRDGHDGAAGNAGPSGPAGATGAAGGMTVTDGAGVALGNLINSLPSNGALIHNATENVVAAYQTFGDGQPYAYLATVTALYYTDANCAGSIYAPATGLHASKELFVFDPNRTGTTTTVYKTSSTVRASVNSNSYIDSSGVCTNQAQPAYGVQMVTAVSTSMPQRVALPLQFSSN